MLLFTYLYVCSIALKSSVNRKKREKKHTCVFNDFFLHKIEWNDPNIVWFKCAQFNCQYFDPDLCFKSYNFFNKNAQTWILLAIFQITFRKLLCNLSVYIWWISMFKKSLNVEEVWLVYNNFNNMLIYI